MPARAARAPRALAELLLERYGIVTREQVLAEGMPGGFALLYDAFADLETLGVCRRGYFIEGMGGAQFALPGAVERLRATRCGAAGTGAATARPSRPRALPPPTRPSPTARRCPGRATVGQRAGAPARVAGAYVVLVADEPALYVERGGRGLFTLAGDPSAGHALRSAPAGSSRCAPPSSRSRRRSARARGRLALERIDGSRDRMDGCAETLVELGFQPGPRRFTLSA